MNPISGFEAKVPRQNPTRFEQGVYFLSRSIESILGFAFFYNRLRDELKSGKLSGMEHEKAYYSFMACHTVIVAEIHKLLDKRQDSWSFDQLFQEWKLLEHDVSRHAAVSASIRSLQKTLSFQSDYRNTRLAHQSKGVRPTDLTALPEKIDHLQEVLDVMDEFVSSPIPYSLFMHDLGEELDLRSLLGLT